MLKSLKNLFFKDSSNIDLEDIPVVETEEEKFKKKSLDEKAIIVSNLFAEKLKTQYDFDDVNIIIEDQNDIKYNSEVFKTLASFGFISDIKDEFSFNKYILESGFKTINEKKVVIFSIFRKYINMYERKMMIGFIFEDGFIYFDSHFNKKIFNHFRWNGVFKSTEYSDNVYNSSHYVYDYKKDELSYIIDIILDTKFGSISLRNKLNNEYFPFSRTHLLSFKLAISKQDCSYHTVANLTYKEEVLRTLEFLISNEDNFNEAINRMLFPYNLELERLKELGLENLDIKDIKNLFEDEFKIYNMIKI